MAENTPGAPSWVELITTDGDKAMRFYGELFGWTFNETGPEYGGYRIITAGDGSVVGGGMIKDATRMGDVPDSFSLYLATPDAVALTQRVREAGGEVVLEPMQVGDEGHMAFYLDPAGAPVGGWQAVGMEPMAIGREVGHPMWFELLTSDLGAAEAFYRDAFEWQPQEMVPGYLLNGDVETSTAGICDASDVLAQGVPAHWRIYFAVADTDEACAKVVELGGTVVEEPTDSEHGRNAACTDDQGALFLVSGPNRES